MIVIIIGLVLLLIIAIVIRVVYSFKRLKVGDVIKYRDGKHILEGKVEYIGNSKISVNNEYIAKTKIVGVVPKTK